MIEGALLSTMVASSVMQVELQERTTNTCQTCADVAEYFRILSASQVVPCTHRAKMTAQVAATTSVDLDRQALENGNLPHILRCRRTGAAATRRGGCT